MAAEVDASEADEPVSRGTVGHLPIVPLNTRLRPQTDGPATARVGLPYARCPVKPLGPLSPPRDTGAPARLPSSGGRMRRTGFPEQSRVCCAALATLVTARGPKSAVLSVGFAHPPPTVPRSGSAGPKRDRPEKPRGRGFQHPTKFRSRQAPAPRGD